MSTRDFNRSGKQDYTLFAVTPIRKWKKVQRTAHCYALHSRKMSEISRSLMTPGNGRFLQMSRDTVSTYTRFSLNTIFLWEHECLAHLLRIITKIVSAKAFLDFCFCFSKIQQFLVCFSKIHQLLLFFQRILSLFMFPMDCFLTK